MPHLLARAADGISSLSHWEALQTLEIRLYAECHLTSWEASELELAQIREYMYVEPNEDLGEAC
jgi:hypothetical protein